MPETRWQTVSMRSMLSDSAACCTADAGDRQGGHSPGKPGKVREFKSGQGKVWENVFLHA